MKLLIDARTLGEKPSGIGMYLYRFTKGLAQRGAYEITLLTNVCESREMRELEAMENVTVRSLGRKIRKGPELWRYFRFLRREIEREKPELFWEVNNLLPITLRNPYGKYLVTIHDIFPITLPEQHSAAFCAYFRYGLKKTIRCCDAVIYDCETMHREIAAHFPELGQKPYHVGYAVAGGSEGEETERGNDFLYVGNLEKRKGTDILLEAYRLYRERGGRRGLVLAGKLRDREIEAQLHATEESTPGLRYLGYITDQERNRLYRSCHAYLFPSRAEGFGLPLVEALDCGAPVIASRLEVLEEIANDQVSWFEPDTGAEGLCAKMLADEPVSPQGWDNPFTEERLIPMLDTFFREQSRKKICFDGQIFMDPVLTGIGTLAWETAREAIRDPRFTYAARAFTIRRRAARLDRLEELGFTKDQIELCTFFHRGVYLRIFHYLPLPYAWFFPRRSDVSVFWNYDAPPGVKGKCVAYVHDMTCMACPETMDEAVRRIHSRNIFDTCRRADAIATISEFSKSEIVRYMGVEPEKIHVIPCGVDHSRFHPEKDRALSAELGEKYGIHGDYFLYLGTLEPRKNVALLLEAYRELLALMGEDCPALVLAGKRGWQMEQLEEKLNDPSLQGHLVTTDYVPLEEVPALMRGALAFLFPSRYEGFGLPPAEAMACGTPVIVSDQASLPEVVGDAGLIVSVEDAHPLCQAMRRVAEDEALRAELSRRGIERAARYTWKNAAKTLLDVCDAL